jgi:pilus assembly protein CpaB
MKAKLILILAVVMGLFTTFLFYQYMQRFDQDVVPASEWVEVIAASKTILENQRITEDMLVMAKLPKEAVTGEFITDKHAVIGKVAEARMAAGETILSHRLVDEQKESLLVSRKIQEGYKAISVGVNFVQTVSNLIEPEDKVDVVVTEADRETGEITSELVMENVRVLAVGRRMIELNTQEAYMEYSAVSLEVKTKDAVKIINADERGNIQLILHSRVNRVEAGENQEVK